MPMARVMRSSLTSPTPISFISGETISLVKEYCSRRFSTSALIWLSKFSAAFMPAFWSLATAIMSLVDGADEASHGFRVRRDQLARHHHTVGVEVHAVVAEREPLVVLVGILVVQDQVEVAGDIEHQGGVNIALDQHRVLQVRRHVGK